MPSKSKSGLPAADRGDRLQQHQHLDRPQLDCLRRLTEAQPSAVAIS